MSLHLTNILFSGPPIDLSSPMMDATSSSLIIESEFKGHPTLWLYANQSIGMVLHCRRRVLTAKVWITNNQVSVLLPQVGCLECEKIHDK